MKWYVTGDCHGDFTRFENLIQLQSTGIICLGDFGVNFYLNKNDYKNKKWLSGKYPHFTFYCVHGNHEARPQDIKGITPIYDHNVGGIVFQEDDFPNIRYFTDYGKYSISGYDVAVIGGAYSVDKWYRLLRAGIQSDEDNNPKRTGWFSDEQLTKEEMEEANIILGGHHYDFVFSHTCPIEFQPKDLFLGFVDQSKVDPTMELWMNELKDKFEWDVWCFGHYHADRIERPGVEQYFHDMEELDIISNRWKRYKETKELDWWLNKSPNFYMGE